MVRPVPLESPDVANAASQYLMDRTEEMEQDLMAARAVQRFLLPAESQDIGSHHVTYLYHPLHHIGGDFLDVAIHASGTVLFMIADVSGHGVAAAMSSAMLKTVFVRHAAASVDPGEILTRVDRDLSGMVRFGRFITALVVAFDPETQTVKLASAGHPPPLLLRNGQARTMEMEFDLPLLTQETAKYVIAGAAQLRPPDRLLMYTDGVIEAADKAGGMLGLEGLAKLAEQVLAHPGGEFMESLFDKLLFGDFVLRDDVTFMCLDVQGT